MDEKIKFLFHILPVVVASVLPLPARALTCQDQSNTLSFSEFPVNTFITDQYANKGAVFSGSGAGPFITTDGANPSSPVLSGSPRFFGSIEAKYVDPEDKNIDATATEVAFDAGYFDEVGTTTVTYYSLDSRVLGTQTNSQFGIQRFTIPGYIHRFTIASTTTDPAGFAIDNLTFRIDSPLKVDSPSKDDMFALTAANYTETQDISFKTNPSNTDGPVSWTVDLEYATSGGRGQTQQQDRFKSQSGSAAQKSYASRGGRLQVQASAKLNGSTVETCTLQYFYVIGVPIPDNEITTRLVGLYRGATARLMTGIVTVESAYQQFRTFTLYNKSARWPNESYDGGSHMGLMQMPTTLVRAWDWLVNTRDGVRLFQEKLRVATRVERRIQRNNRGLRRLTAVERENMALVLYGPYASADLNQQYYVPQVSGNIVDWVVNSANNPQGVSYANNVRASMR